ncbi:MAG: hypothetical protein JO301_06920 [Chitinophagaceae bacterium]|nr:hypothetical protein [Chitinophagaceae bacterium]
MKKIFVLVFSLFTFVLAQAQTKVTKAGVVGKWTISTIEMPGIFGYNTETDSMFIGETIKSQIQDPKQMELVKSQFRTQMGVMAKMVFQFNADGSALLINGVTEPAPATYTVDEEKSTITTLEKGENKEKETINAEFVNGKMKLKLNSANGEIVLLLKKS